VYHSNDGTAAVGRLPVVTKGYIPLVQKCIVVVLGCCHHTQQKQCLHHSHDRSKRPPRGLVGSLQSCKEPTQRKLASSWTKKLRSPLSYEKIDAKLKAFVDASVTKFFSQFRKMSPPVKTPEEHATRLMVLKIL
jgi:hypothetical protein